MKTSTIKIRLRMRIITVVLLLVVVAEGFTMPTVGFTTVLDTIGIGVGTLGLEDTVCVSVLVGTGSCVLLTLSEREVLD